MRIKVSAKALEQVEASRKRRPVLGQINQDAAKASTKQFIRRNSKRGVAASDGMSHTRPPRQDARTWPSGAGHDTPRRTVGEPRRWRSGR